MSSSPALGALSAAMSRTNEIFNTEVFGKKNFAALDEIYTVNARILPPGSPAITGREAIRKFWSDFVASTEASAATLTTVEANEAGAGIVEIGRATVTIPYGQLEAKYVVYWLQEDGQWKWDIDIWNLNE